MTVAELSQSIEVYRIQNVINEGGTGGPTPVFAFATFAKIELMSEREAFQQGINTDTVVYKITYRYLSDRDIKKDDIIKWNGQSFTARSNSKPVMIKTKRWFKNTMALQGA